MKKTLIIFSAVLLMYGCDVVKQFGGAYNLSQCKYDYNSIDNIQIAGVNIGQGKSLSIANIATLSTILAGGNLQNIPFNMTLNLDVLNPNEAPAYLNGLDYMIELNDMEFANGKLDTPLRIEGGETSLLPLSIGLDLRNLINRYSQDKVASEMSRFLGVSAGQTKVTVKLWPKILVGDVPITSPTYIPVTFLFGENK
ncbi:MAG TPA: LEA type 2 family protein [Dysgonamonadaceae bacterium]|nr:LEA type 2 family protein [Dysgonamonadaceae bacterium]